MKRTLSFLVIMYTLYGCAEKPKKDHNPETEVTNHSEEHQLKSASENLETSLEELEGFFNTADTGEAGAKPEVEALQKLLLQMGSAQGNGTTGLPQEQQELSSTFILELLEASGVSKAEMERLINNPDSLRILVQEAKKNKEQALKDEAVFASKLSKEQLVSKHPSTGVSLEQAILLVQAESGPGATIEKLKKVDSLAGTNVMEQLDLNEAQSVFNTVERKNDPSSSLGEEEKMRDLRKLSSQLHSDKEAVKILEQLKQTESDIASGKIKASPKYARYLTNRRKVVKIFSADFRRKSKRAIKKFQELNPDLYFGEEAGTTYVGSGADKTPVYLPLGKLAFADKVIATNHPKRLTSNLKNVIGEPDVIYGFEVEDVTGIYSLGFGGDLTVQFVDNALTDVNGPDLYIFEFGTIEPTNLEISKDGKNWIEVGKIEGGVAQVDIAEFTKPGELFYYVRLKDLLKATSLPGADIDAIAAIGSAMRLSLDSKVLFATGKSELKPEGIEALKKLTQSIVVLKRGNVIIEGHTDDVGSDATNKKLSLARAKSVSKELKKMIPGSSFKWNEKGFGESKPLVANDSEENRAKNRRVEVLILPN